MEQFKDETMFDHLSLKASTYFGRFLRPSSGAYNCTHSFRYCQPILLQAGIVDEMDTTIPACSSTGWQYL